MTPTSAQSNVAGQKSSVPNRSLSILEGRVGARVARRKVSMSGSRRAALALLIAMIPVLSGCSAPSAAPRPAPTGPDPLASATHHAGDDPPGAALTQRGDESWLGWYQHEPRLTVDSVRGGQFGKVANLPVDGKVDAQPLYVPELDRLEVYGLA